MELDPRKVGHTIQAVPVIPPAEVGRSRGTLALATVGVPGARDEIRASLTALGWREMVDFVAVA